MSEISMLEKLARARIAEVCDRLSNKSSYIAMTTCLKMIKAPDDCRKDFSDAISSLHLSRMRLHMAMEEVKRFAKKLFTEVVPEKSQEVLNFMEESVASADTTISKQIEAMQALSALEALGVQEITPSVIFSNFNDGCVMALIFGEEHVPIEMVIEVNKLFLVGDALDINAYVNALHDVTKNPRMISVTLLDDKQMLESFKNLYDSSRAAVQGGLH